MSTDGAAPSAGPQGLLVAAAAALARGGHPDEGISELLRLGVEAVGADGGVVFGRDPDGPGLALVASAGASPEGETEEPGASIVAAALEGRRTLERTASVAGRAATAADLPLVATRGGIEQRLGAVTFAWAAVPSLSGHDLALLGAVADLLAVALDRSRLATLAVSRAERAEQLALMDGLTGLANARTLDRVLELEVTRAGRQGGEICVAVFDIDRFAALNERAGRGAGDDALRRVASAVAGSVRLVDTVARTGADEFVVVAPGSAGQAVARRILEAVSSLPEAAGAPIRVSAGIARFPGDAASAAELLDVARRALDRARDAGDGRIAGGDAIEPTP